MGGLSALPPDNNICQFIGLTDWATEEQTPTTQNSDFSIFDCHRFRGLNLVLASRAKITCTILRPKHAKGHLSFPDINSPFSQRVGASSVFRVGDGKLRRISGKRLNSYWEAVYICWSEG